MGRFFELKGTCEWRRRGEFRLGEVVTICDHLQFLLRRKLRHRIKWALLDIPEKIVGHRVLVWAIFD